MQVEFANAGNMLLLDGRLRGRRYIGRCCQRWFNDNGMNVREPKESKYLLDVYVYLRTELGKPIVCTNHLADEHLLRHQDRVL